jgi:phospholipid/cholesterol/gamma-HCH transport system substrate-binding protein
MKYFTKEVKIALTAIAAAVLLFFGINFMKGINLFKSENTYYVEFSDIKGLTISSQVFADGYSIGLVRGIDYNKKCPGHVIVEFDVEDGTRIPFGTTAVVDRALLGGTDMTLLLGNNPRPRYNPGDTIKGSDVGSVMEQAQTLIPKVESSLSKLDSILSRINVIVNDPAIPALLHNAQVVSQNLNESSAQLKVLLTNDVPQLTGKLNHIGSNVDTFTGNLNRLDLEGTLGRVDSTLANVHTFTARLNDKNSTLGLLISDPSLYNNLNTTVGSANDLLKDIKTNPKHYVHFSLFGKKDKKAAE